MFLPYFFSFELEAYGAQYLNYSANLPYSHLVVALFISVLSVFILFHSQYHIFLCKRNTKMVMGRCPFSASEKIEENKGKKAQRHSLLVSSALAFLPTKEMTLLWLYRLPM